MEFEAAVEPHRHELRVHCYRMLGSAHDAEDVVQETMLRAWRACDTLRPRAGLDPHVAVPDRDQRLPQRAARAGQRRPLPSGIGPVVRRSGGGARPGLRGAVAPAAPRRLRRRPAVERSRLRLAFVAALQLLPPRQRAALILREVLDVPAAERRRPSRHDDRERQQRAAASTGAPRARWASTPTRRPSRRPSSAPSSTASSPRSSVLTSRRSPRCLPMTSCSRCRRCGTGTAAGTTSAAFMRRVFRTRGSGMADRPALGERRGGLRGVRVRHAPHRDVPHRGSTKGDARDRVPGGGGVRSLRARPMNPRTFTGR